MTPSSRAPAVSVLPPGQQTYQATQTTGDGYKQTMSLTLHPAIPGRDLAVLKAAWSAVGGIGPVPCLDASDISGTTVVTIPTHSSVYAVGTLTITNNTADFGSGGMRWDFIVPGLSYGAAMGFGYSDGPECDGLDSGTLTSPHWTHDTWGPVPVVVAYGDIVNPNHPDGDYSTVAKAPLQLLDTGTLQTLAITSGGTPVTTIAIVPASPAWLQQAQGPG
ncbi:hypothetical protein [Streptacidiphilus cavernicola]|uniref:ATP/GTP-binding protein n=1 Tax=Streptacidiphilus cavernicola TaxID=3342716 RepID=A0ABV6VXK1_9ACTN